MADDGFRFLTDERRMTHAKMSMGSMGHCFLCRSMSQWFKNLMGQWIKLWNGSVGL